MRLPCDGLTRRDLKYHCQYIMYPFYLYAVPATRYTAPKVSLRQANHAAVPQRSRPRPLQGAVSISLLHDAQEKEQTGKINDCNRSRTPTLIADVVRARRCDWFNTSGGVRGLAYRKGFDQKPRVVRKGKTRSTGRRQPRKQFPSLCPAPGHKRLHAAGLSEGSFAPRLERPFHSERKG